MPSLLLLSQFPGRWTSCHFHCAGFLSNSVSTMWAFAELGFSCAWPSLHRRWAKVVSARLNPRNGTRYVRGVCHFLGSVSPQQKFEVAATAKSLQSCPTLCNPIDSSPPGSLIPGIFQARTLEWVAISFSNAWKWKMKVKSLSNVRLLATPWTAAYQAPLSMGFVKQEYWSGLPLPSPIWSGRPVL